MWRSGFLWLSLFVLISGSTALAPYLAPFDPSHTAPLEQFSPPDAVHWMGTDQFGRDLFSRVLWGGQSTLAGATLSTVIAISLGALSGLIAAACGSWLDWAIMRVVDVLLIVPGLLVAMLLVAAFGRGILPASVGVGMALAPGFSRLVRAATLTVRHQNFIEASRALGASRWRILRKHLLPNILDEILAFVAVLFAWSLLNMAALEFLGLVGSPSTPRWGHMLLEGREFLRIAPWIALWPSIVLTTSILAVMGISDAWRARRLGQQKRKMSPEDGDTFR